MIWEEFEEMLYERFFNEIARANKVVKFINLKQEDMIIAQYVSRFIQLSRFVENMVVQDLNRDVKFLMCLQDDIYIKLMYQGM